MTDRREKELINKLKCDDTRAFEKLFDFYHHKVFNFSWNVLGSKMQAEEITQEVFIAIWQNRKKLDSSGSFISYVFAITRNQINNYINKTIHQKVFIEYVTRQGEKPQLLTENDVLFNELQVIYKRVVNDLPPKRKTIYKASKIEGLTYKQIAEKFKISENTVDTQIRKAIETIRKRIEKEYKI